jgi:hypothetical protein
MVANMGFPAAGEKRKHFCGKDASANLFKGLKTLPACETDPFPAGSLHFGCRTEWRSSLHLSPR